MRLRWSVPAADDLENIKNYLQQHYPDFAELTVRSIYHRIRYLKTSPNAGRPDDYPVCNVYGCGTAGYDSIIINTPYGANLQAGSDAPGSWSGPIETIQTPEPTGLVLLGIALVGAASRGLRSKGLRKTVLAPLRTP